MPGPEENVAGVLGGSPKLETKVQAQAAQLASETGRDPEYIRNAATNEANKLKDAIPGVEEEIKSTPDPKNKTENKEEKKPEKNTADSPAQTGQHEQKKTTHPHFMSIEQALMESMTWTKQEALEFFGVKRTGAGETGKVWTAIGNGVGTVKNLWTEPFVNAFQKARNNLLAEQGREPNSFVDDVKSELQQGATAAESTNNAEEGRAPDEVEVVTGEPGPGPGPGAGRF